MISTKSNLQLINAASAEHSENESDLTKLDLFLLKLGAKVMKQNSRGQSEPKLSVVFWLALVAIAVLVAVAFFFGQLAGYSEGIQKGKEQSTVEQLQDEVKALKEKDAKQKQFEQNLKIAEEFDKKQKANSNK